MRWLLCALLALPAHGQTSATAGSIRGTVLDGTGSAIPNARVTAVEEGTRLSRAAEADSAGRFFLGNLPAGSYTLRLEAAGFAPAVAGPLPLSVGQVIEQRVGMQPAGIVEKLEVTELPEAIDVSAATASVVLGGERIEEAPARSRNYLNFVLAAPAVAPSGGAASQRTMTGVRTPMGDSGFTFGGMRPRNNAILIDGMDNRDETTGGNRVAVGLEMVQEFRVAGSAVGAELGGAAGGLLNMVTRSGVNLFHGDATFFVQNETFNAAKPEVSGAQPRFRRYQPGVSLLGPLRRDRTFFAWAVEHERESAEEWSGVPAAAIDRINGALAGPAFSDAGVRRVWRGLYETGTRGTDLSSKLSHQFGVKDTVAARYAFSRGRVRGEVQGPDNFADRSAQGNSLTTDHSLVANWLRVASPTVVNEVRFQTASRSMSLTPNAAGPMLEIPGVATMGEYHRMNSDRTERHEQVVENLHFTAGAHRMSIGADAHRIRFSGSLRARFAGLFVFPTLDDFAAGRPDVYVQAFGEARTRMATLPVGLWLQDRWEARPGLHLELGVRFDRQAMPAGLPPSSNNMAPRVGLAWRPAKETPLVVRAGFGLYFDRYPLAFLNDALQKDGVRGFEMYATGAAARAVFSASRAGFTALPATGLTASAYRAADDFPAAFARKFNAGAEYGFDKNTSLSFEANHVRGFHLPRVRNIAGGGAPRYLLEQTARSDYLGASVTLNRRLHKDLGYLMSYTVGRTDDDGSDFDEHPQDPFDIRRDWARSRQHQRHRLALSALFELPVDHWLLEEVSFAPIFTMGSGRPINALLTTDAYRSGAYPISARPVGLARNPYFAPRTMGLDLRVMKTFPVMDERALLQIGVESFNLTNHSTTERVSPYFASPAGRLSSYGATLESLPARQIQFLVQFEF